MKRVDFETTNKNILESFLTSGIAGFAASGIFTYLSGHLELQPGLVSWALIGTAIFF